MNGATSGLVSSPTTSVAESELGLQLGHIAVCVQDAHVIGDGSVTGLCRLFVPLLFKSK